MTGQEARDGEREALIAAARTSIADADRCVALHITPSTGTLHRRLREVTRALADAHTELAARKHPEPEVTDEMVERALVAAQAAGPLVPIRARLEVALAAAFRVPVGEGEQG